MSQPDFIEFYRTDSYYPFASIASSMQPVVGDIVSILGHSWVVVSRNYALDHIDDPRCARMRLALNVKAAPKKKVHR